MRTIDFKELFEEARKARLCSYSPYSKFRVGAAVLSDSGRIFSGCNVENASYGLTVCAERVATLKAISEGARKIVALVISTGDHEHRSPEVTPCGACLQVLSEFAAPDTMIAIEEGAAQKLSDFLPNPFRLLKNL